MSKFFQQINYKALTRVSVPKNWKKVTSNLLLFSHTKLYEYRDCLFCCWISQLCLYCMLNLQVHHSHVSRKFYDLSAIVFATLLLNTITSVWEMFATAGRKILTVFWGSWEETVYRLWTIWITLNQHCLAILVVSSCYVWQIYLTTIVGWIERSIVNTQQLKDVAHSLICAVVLAHN